MQNFSTTVPSLTSSPSAGQDRDLSLRSTSTLMSFLESLHHEVSTNPSLPSKLSENPTLASRVKSLMTEFPTLKNSVEELQSLPDKSTNASNEVESAFKADYRELVKEEVRTKAKIVQEALLPTAQFAESEIVLELRARGGGDAAAAFTGMLHSMYTKYASKMGLEVEALVLNENKDGGVTYGELHIKGKGAHYYFQNEGGTHTAVKLSRVIDAPSSPKLSVSIAVMPLRDDKTTALKDSDIEISVTRSGGNGGQGVNTTDSAVQITHIPTGITARIQTERSQIQNRKLARRILEERVAEYFDSQKHGNETSLRREQVGVGTRLPEIRSYNFDTKKIIDMRLGKEVHGLNSTLGGDLNAITQQIHSLDRTIALGDLLARGPLVWLESELNKSKRIPSGKKI